MSQSALLARGAALAERLPACPLAVNYCERRDHFAVALLAVWLRGQTAVFPADRTEHTFAMLREDAPDLYALSDGELDFEISSLVRVDGVSSDPGPAQIPDVACSHLAAKVYTSGSTGKPSVNEKSWGMLVAGGKAIPRMLQLHTLKDASVVATVPSQHMYGFETTIMNVLQGETSAHVERPVYPADIARCLAEVAEPRVLVTTPVHLRALVEAGTDLPGIERVISATAPLSTELALAAEKVLDSQVWEIYGFTEIGSVAGRHTVATEDWVLRDGLFAREEDGGQHVYWQAFDRKIPFPDIVQVVDESHIRLEGRAQDIVNIAGKRASLSGLSAKLLEIEGVEDGAFWLPVEDSGMGVVSRLVAFVVAPDLNERDVRTELQRRLDSAFVPRSIHIVDSLPRNATGKLTQRAMKEFALQIAGGDATA
ncbi:MAG: AMP-binding protein [Pseudomonadota bacterium]